MIDTDTTKLEFKTLPFDASDPLARIEDESIRANNALRDYVGMGSGRSLRDLAQRYSEPSTKNPPTRHIATLANWSTRFYWQRRLDAWQQLVDAEWESEWKERIKAIRDTDYQWGQDLRTLAAKILAEGPKFIRTSRKLMKGQDGAPDREIITLALDGYLMVKALETASKLERQAAEMEDPAKRVTIQIDKELKFIFSVLERVLDDDSYSRVLDALSNPDNSEAKEITATAYTGDSVAE